MKMGNMSKRQQSFECVLASHISYEIDIEDTKQKAKSVLYLSIDLFLDTVTNKRLQF